MCSVVDDGDGCGSPSVVGCLAAMFDYVVVAMRRSVCDDVLFFVVVGPFNLNLMPITVRALVDATVLLVILSSTTAVSIVYVVQTAWNSCGNAN